METKQEQFSEKIRQSKIFLINVLREETDFILQLVQQDKLLTDREYENLKDGPPEKTVINLLDKLRNKGDKTCKKFIQLLGQDFMLETFPKLKNHPILATDNPVQDTSKLSTERQQKLHRIYRELTSINVAHLKFLCMDLVSKKHLETVCDAKGLCLQLEKQELLDDGLLLPELLYRIGRLDLLVILGTSREEVERHLQAFGDPNKGVSAYRYMLYRLSVGITDESLHQIKFQWSKCVETGLGPSALKGMRVILNNILAFPIFIMAVNETGMSKLQKAHPAITKTFLDVVIEMEKVQRLGKDNLDELQNILNQCDKQLAYKIEEFKNRPRYQEQEVYRNYVKEVTNHEVLRVTLPEDEYYTMTQRPSGYCLIINNYEFSQMSNRRGTEKDKDGLTKVFHKMHFLVDVRNNLQALDMLNVIHEFAQKDHSRMNAFICCILTHGEQGTVLGTDSQSILIRDLTFPFIKCHTLANKPKLFFIQACQCSREGMNTAQVSYKDDADPVPNYTVPIDFLIGMSTVENYQSFRHVKKGSIYIQELCRQLEKCCPRKEDILSIMTKVNREVSKTILKGFKQIPEPRYTLTKKLVLPWTEAADALLQEDESPRAMDITRSLAEMIAKDLQPLSVVEDEGFRNFVRTLNPRYRIPSRKNLMEGKISAMYEECHSKVKKSLDGANSTVLTTDMWTSKATEACLTVSCHIIDENWQMQAYVLETCSFSGQHNTDNICSELIRVTDEWGITNKVQAVITDNGTNMVAAVHKAGWAHYPCFAHTLNLAVKDSIKALPDLFDIKKRCSAIVAFFNHSTEAAERLREVQKQLKAPEHKLIQSVETRWNSVFYMFERLFEQKKPVTTALCLLGKTSLCLCEEDWSMISLSINALRPFEEVTREISAEKHVSLSKVIPLVSLLLRSTASYQCQGSKLAAELSAQCQCHFKGIESIYGLAVSTYLDIRFKNLGFRDMANVEPVKARLITEIQSMNQTSHLSSVSAPEPSSASAMAIATTSSSPADAAAKGGIWREFDSQVLALQLHRTTGTDAFIEMWRYSEEKPISRNQDPLLWWKMNEPMFPSLSKLAKKHLGVIASSVPAERIFSKAGQLVSQRRSALKGKHVNMLLFLNQNL